MKRPIYETTINITKEAAIAGELSAAWNCDVIKLPRLYSCDYAAMRDGSVSAWIEIKCRNRSYPTYLLSLHKWLKGVELSNVTGKPFILVVSWDDKIIYKNVTNEPVKIVIGGRKDRGDPADIEPMVEIEISGFKKL